MYIETCKDKLMREVSLHLPLEQISPQAKMHLEHQYLGIIKNVCEEAVEDYKDKLHQKIKGE